MANTSSNIENYWSLVNFAMAHDRKMAVVQCTNQDTGEIFHACAFGADRDSRVFASFSRKLGEMTPAEIVAQKDDLQVVEWNNPETGKHGYSLCKKGNSDKFQEVDLGL